MIEAQQLVRPEALLVATYRTPTGVDETRVVLSCRYVPAFDQTGTLAVALELAFDPLGQALVGYYYCPVSRIQRQLISPNSLRLLRPFVRGAA